MDQRKSETTLPFPNRSWPWRPEDDRCPEALAARVVRPEPDYHWENGAKVYHSWEAFYDV